MDSVQTALFIQVVDNSLPPVEGILTTASSDPELFVINGSNTFEVWDNTTGYPNLTWPPVVGGGTFPNVLPGVPGSYIIINTTPPLRDVKTELKVTQWLRYRFLADHFVSVGEDPRCSCQNEEWEFSPLTAQPVRITIDGHRDDVFVSEEKELLLPILRCKGCQVDFYHLSLIKEFV